MAQITIYRSVNSLATHHNQVCVKVAELVTDIPNFQKQLIELQTVAGHVYVHVSDALDPAELAYYEVEKVS